MDSCFLDLTPFTNLYRKQNVLLYKIFHRNGYELRLAGATVCKILMGFEPNAIELVTTATPAQMIEIIQREDTQDMECCYEDEETVTVTVSRSSKFIIRTIRRNPSTSGDQDANNSAVDWRLDSNHNDLTVNSMYVTIDLASLPPDSTGSTSNVPHSSNQSPPSPVRGYLYDNYGGVEDLRNRRIRFIGSPAARISEDPLRILRYFRFHGLLVKPSEIDSHDPNVLKAISDNAANLRGITGFRYWTELKGILRCQTAPQLLFRMSMLGLFRSLDLPQLADFTAMTSAWERGILNSNPEPVTCLATLLTTFSQASSLSRRLRLSRLERKILIYIVGHRSEYTTISKENMLQRFQRDLLLSNDSPYIIQKVMGELMRYLVVDHDMLSQFEEWNVPLFPISALRIRCCWEIPPQDVRPCIPVLRRQWVESNCTLSAEQLLSPANRTIVERLVRQLQTNLGTCDRE